ncbi:phenylacetate--CoA ligase family protein [Nocardia zapadnayensis]|uniref:phenylacetate--CoA ligase family protein n=1 Tax=Nocardia rhamnosiphila TaxID=426716 RepID=UPI0022478CEF|nr:phenylacetate--CoA ligase family protein [Nocardia zapadnayensis]MCX0272846.1 phenylacetate--CoA ligase family protein [Nocardia zapadnayensis]
MDAARSSAFDSSAADDPNRRFFQPDIETMSREGIQAAQEKRVLELVPAAYENSPFYRELWSAAGVDPARVRSLDDFFEMVPTFTKDDLRAYRTRTGDPFSGLLQVPTSRLTSVMSTSGTTGTPELLPEIWDTAPPLPACSARDLWELGVRPGDRVIVPAGVFRGFFDTFYQEMGLVPIYVDAWIGQGAEIIAALQRYRPTYIQLIMPTVLELERLAGSYDLRDGLSSLRGASFAGQPLGAALAAKVSEEWGVELFIYSSAGDTGTAWECREHNGFHLWEDLVLAENLEPGGRGTVPAGEVGELVATDLDNQAAPLIRYRSGDLVRLDPGRCGCGRTHLRQWIIGRLGDETIVRGRPVVVGEVWKAVETQEETHDGMFQIIREERVVDRLRLRVGYTPADGLDLADLGVRLRAAVTAQVGVEPEIELVPVDDLVARSSSVAKFPRVVKA